MWGKMVEEGKQHGIFKWLIIISYAFFLYNISYFMKGFTRVGVIMTPILYGFIIAYIMNPIINKVNTGFKKLGMKKKTESLAILLSYILMTIFLFSLILIILPKLIHSLTNIFQALPVLLPEWIERGNIRILSFTDKIGLDLGTRNIAMEQLKIGLLEKYNTDKMIGMVIGITSSVSSMLLNVVLGIIISIYMVMHKDMYRGKIKKVILAYIPEDKGKRFINWMSKVNDTFSNFIVAKIIDSIIIGIIAYIGCIILGIKNAMLIGVIIGVTNVVPYFGPIIGAIPAATIVLMQGFGKMFLFIIFILVLQQFDGNYLGPKLMGSKLGMNSLLIIIAVIVMSGVLGIIGVFIGVPLFAIIYMLFSDDVTRRLKLKGKSTKTEDYL